MMRRPNWLFIGLLFVAGTLWGIAFLVAEIVLRTIPPFTYIFSRNVLVAGALLVALIVRGEKLPRFGRAWLPFFAVALFDNTLPLMLSSNAQLFVDSGLVTIFVSTTPFFTLILAYFLMADEPIGFNQVLGVILGLLGIVVLIGPTALQEIGVNFWSQMALLGASLCYAIATIFSRSYLRKNDGQAKYTVLSWLTGQFIVSTFIMLPIMLIFDDMAQIRPSSASVAAVFVAAWGIAVFAFLSFYQLNALAGPTYASFVTYLIPINGVFWGAIILREQVTINALIALGFILGGIGAVNGFVRMPAFLRKKPPTIGEQHHG